jgi:hypothetical protein
MMRNRLFLLPAFVCLAAQAAPGFKQSISFAAFEGWAKGATVPGLAFKEAKDEPEAYQAWFKGKASTENFTLKIEGAGKFEGVAGEGAKATKFSWKGLEAQFVAADSGASRGALIAVKYGASKATLSLSFKDSPKPRTQADLEKLLASLNPEKILK